MVLHYTFDFKFEIAGFTFKGEIEALRKKDLKKKKTPTVPKQL